MKTILFNDAERSSHMLCQKVAERPDDLPRLKRLRANIALLRVCAPEMAPEIVDEDVDMLILTAVNGVTFTAEQAVPVYDSQPWITDSVLAQIDRLQACAPHIRPTTRDRYVLLRHLLRPLKFGVRFPWIVQRQLVSLLLRYPTWVLTHGDLQTWNIVVDKAAQVTTLIDWETLAIRPKYYDEFRLAFHRCTPLSEMSWQRTLLRKRLHSQPQPAAKSTQAVAVAALSYYYGKEPARVQSVEELDRRSEIRYENMIYLAKRANWESWLDSILG